MKRILVIEDDPDIQEMLCAYLRDAGYEALPPETAWRRWSCFARAAGPWFCWT